MNILKLPDEEESSVTEVKEVEIVNKSPTTSSSLPADFQTTQTTQSTQTTYTYFSREWRNLQRKRFMDYLHTILKSDHEESNKMMSFSMKCIHFSFPILLVPIVMLSPGWVVYVLFISCILMKIIFWYFNGCFLSNLEYKLNKENDVNVVDPLVFAIGKKISKESRIEVTEKATNLLITFLAAMIIWKGNRELSGE